jgi:mannose-6-phosphate isomerase-like protein (cupin superfamily)
MVTGHGLPVARLSCTMVPSGEGAMFATRSLPDRADEVAPDGSEVRVLLGTSRGGMAHFRLAAGETSVAVHHRTVEEIWFFVAGEGEMWRRRDDEEDVVPVAAGVCITLPVGTDFQFRAVGVDALTAVGVAMPPWPGAGEAVRVDGRWVPTVAPGAGLAER